MINTITTNLNICVNRYVAITKVRYKTVNKKYKTVKIYMYVHILHQNNKERSTYNMCEPI